MSQEIKDRIIKLKGSLEDKPNFVSKLTSIEKTYLPYFDPEILDKLTNFEVMFSGSYVKKIKKETGYFGVEAYTTKDLRDFYTKFLKNPGETMSDYTDPEFKEIYNAIMKELEKSTPFIEGQTNDKSMLDFTNASKQYNETSTSKIGERRITFSYESKDWKKLDKLNQIFNALQKKYLIFNQTIDPYRSNVLTDFKPEFDKIQKNWTYNKIKETFDTLKKQNEDRIAHYKKVSAKPETGEYKTILQDMNKVINTSEVEKSKFLELQEKEKMAKEATQKDIQKLEDEKKELEILSKKEEDEKKRILESAKNIYEKNIEKEKKQIEENISKLQLSNYEKSLKIAEEQEKKENELKLEFARKEQEETQKISQKYREKIGILSNSIESQKLIIKNKELIIKDTTESIKREKEKMETAMDKTKNKLYDNPTYAKDQLDRIHGNLSWLQKLAQNKTLVIILIIIFIIGTVLVIATWLFFVGIAFLLNLAYQKAYQHEAFLQGTIVSFSYWQLTIRTLLGPLYVFYYLIRFGFTWTPAGIYKVKSGKI